MVLNNIEAKVPVKFSWLKYVVGSNLSEHCAHSLIGEYETRWERYGQPKANNLQLPQAPFYYLCCVTQNYKTNIHIAWKEKKGSLMIIDTPLVCMRVKDAEQIEITNKYIDRTLPQSKDWRFATCRNWWFASYLHSIGI